MEQALRALVLIWFVAMICSSQGHENQRVTQIGYELYSWQESKGDWEFSVLFNTDSQKTVKQVFDRKTALRGVHQLKRKLSELPEGASVFWLNRIPLGTAPKAKGSEGLRYPPPSVIEEIRSFAETRKIKIEVLPSEESGGQRPNS